MDGAPKANDVRPQPRRRNQFDALLQLLPSLTSGSMTMSVNRHPLLKVDPDTKSLSVEAAGVKESGLKLGNASLSNSREKTSLRNLLSSSERLAKGLSRVGWTLTVYDGGTDLLSMGSGVSRLTGHVRANPLRLMKLIRTLRDSGSATG